MQKPFYITTTLPYVNADPHIGFALEIVEADAIARYKKLSGCDVFFNTGTDEHGLKIYRKAIEEGKEPQAYVDDFAERFKMLQSALGLSNDLHFIRTTDSHHKKAAQEFWKRCNEAGYIYKKNYVIKYCVGCELEKTESELVDGHCPIHPNLEIELIDEENYFFAWSKFQKQLLDFYEKNPDFVVPKSRFNEIKAFVERGLEDFSISRLASKMSWGISVPGDPGHVMHVWFDALVNYVSTLGWPEKEGKTSNFGRYWPGVQVAGKDNLRQQSAMWQAMLMATGLPNSKQIFIHGFITSGGQKMSKSLGNVINPFDLVEEYGTDALRYYLLRHVNPFEDSDVTAEKFKENYNANLANGLGNLVNRVTKMAASYDVSLPKGKEKRLWQSKDKNVAEITHYLESYCFNDALDEIWKLIQAADDFVQKREPFKKIKTDPEEAKSDVAELLGQVWHIAELLEPFMPTTSEIIKGHIQKSTVPEKALFPRKE